MSRNNRSARLEARLTPAVYALVQEAARLQGRSISDFVVTAAREAAEAAIEQRQLIELSQADQERFAAALLEPDEPNEALAEAARLHRQAVEPS